MEFQGLLWVVKALPENNWSEKLELILVLSLVAVVLVCSAVSIFISYRRNRFCTCCHSKTVLGLRTEKRPPGKKLTRFGGKWVYGDVTVVVLRCPKCGWEIDLGK